MATDAHEGTRIGASLSFVFIRVYSWPIVFTPPPSLPASTPVHPPHPAHTPDRPSKNARSAFFESAPEPTACWSRCCRSAAPSNPPALDEIDCRAAYNRRSRRDDCAGPLRLRHGTSDRDTPDLPWDH